jgi:drug/metabolite transporter (DMT)-like permease
VCVLAGTCFLGEPLTGQIVAGGALTVFGVWLASRVAKGAGKDTRVLSEAGAPAAANESAE